jgi:hypothetical protein
VSSQLHTGTLLWRAPNFVHSCCFDSMAASSEQPRHRIADNERTAAEAARSVTTYRDPHRSKHSAGRPRSSSMPLIRGHKNGCGSISDPTYHLTSKARTFPTGSWNTQLKDVKQDVRSKQTQYFGRQDVLGAPVWMCNVINKWGEKHWAEFGPEVAATLEQRYQSKDDKPVEFTWTAPTAPQVVIMDGEPEAATGRAPAPKAAHVDKAPMHYKVFVQHGYQENQATKARRDVRRFLRCE